MSSSLVTRFTWTNDSGGGLDGTVVNNAELQKIFDAIDGAIGLVVKVKTSAYTVLVTDDLVKVTSGTFTLDLYTAVGNDGRELAIVNAGTGLITLDPNGAQTIDGLTTLTLGQGQALVLRSDGANWVIVARKAPSPVAMAIVFGG